VRNYWLQKWTLKTQEFKNKGVIQYEIHKEGQK